MRSADDGIAARRHRQSRHQTRTMIQASGAGTCARNDPGIRPAAVRQTPCQREAGLERGSATCSDDVPGAARAMECEAGPGASRWHAQSEALVSKMSWVVTADVPVTATEPFPLESMVENA